MRTRSLAPGQQTLAHTIDREFGLLAAVEIAQHDDVACQLVVAEDEGRAGVDLVGALHAPLQVAAIAKFDVVAGPPQLMGKAQGAGFRRLADRDATHIYALPVLAGELLGMVSIEASCFDDLGPDFVWPVCADALELTLALAAPWLVSLPREPVAAPVP